MKRRSEKRDGMEGRSKRMDAASGLALAAAWRASGQTVREFARARGVPPHRVQYWRRRSEAEGVATEGRPAFLALEVASAEGRESIEHVEVIVGDVRLRFAPGVRRETFIETLRWAQEAVAR